MTTNEEAQKELLRLVEMLGAVAKEMPVTLWETKTPFLRALDKCVDALRHPFHIEKHIELRSEVNILSAYVEFCRAQSATLARIPPTADPEGGETPGRLARIPPTSGDNGPEEPPPTNGPVCR